MQFLVSNYHGPWLVDIAGALVSILSLVVLLRVWQPKTIWRFEHEARRRHGDARPPALETGAVVRAWMPWVLLSLLVFVWGLPQMKAFLNGLSNPQLPIPLLASRRLPRAAGRARAEAGRGGLHVQLALGHGHEPAAGRASSPGCSSASRPRALVTLFGRTLWRVRMSLLTIAAMLALGFTTRYAGLDATMGLAFASTGVLFPFFSPLLGWLGVALTGSDTSSNVLFGNLQKITAEQLGISPILAAAANSTGGVMGKMIDAQSIVVASVATGPAGHRKARSCATSSATASRWRCWSACSCCCRPTCSQAWCRRRAARKRGVLLAALRVPPLRQAHARRLGHAGVV